jgi:serine/threonine protein kinase
MMNQQKIEHALVCPQCNAPLKPSRFAQSVTCSYCGTIIQLDSSAVTAERFHEAFRIWNSPETYQITTWISLGDRHWAVNQQIAEGEISDVYKGRLARWPTELAILKILRDDKDSDRFENEWNALQALHRSEARGADSFTALLPQPIMHGEISPGLYAGKRASIYRRISGFKHTLEDVTRAYPQGIPPQASIWMWRRILEALSFIHASGMVHGAVTPAHLLIQENEHGMRLVGYGCAGKKNQKLRNIASDAEPFYPKSTRSQLSLTPQLDLIMSARCMAAALGGDPSARSLPDAVPIPLVNIVQRIAHSDPTATPGEDAWSIREELGTLANQVFGPPRFIPIVMPS